MSEDADKKMPIVSVAEFERMFTKEELLELAEKMGFVNETKQSVFEELRIAVERNGSYVGREFINTHQLYNRYADALPDDMATLPAAVGERIKLFTERYLDLVDAFGPLKDYAVMRQEPSDPVQAWILHNSAAFARAWLDGVWRVEETGEVVKL